jgi:hypothetical protein
VSQLKWTHFRKPNSLSHLDVLDGVSRAGPLDTAKMFLKLRISLSKRIPDLIVALFAVVTLASFAIDPMVQQVLEKYEDDYQFHNLISSVLTNKHYDALAHDLKATIETQNRLQGTMMKNASLKPWLTCHELVNETQLILHESSFFKQLTGTTLLPDIDCPSPGKRCKFSNITMLGLCSEVLDITKDTKRNCTRQSSTSMDCEYWSDNTSTSRTLSLNFGLTYGHDY